MVITIELNESVARSVLSALNCINENTSALWEQSNMDSKEIMEIIDSLGELRGIQEGIADQLGTIGAAYSFSIERKRVNEEE